MKFINTLQCSDSDCSRISIRCSNRGAAATVKCSTVVATVKLEHSSSSKSNRTVTSAYQLQECISTALQHISIVGKQQHIGTTGIHSNSRSMQHQMQQQDKPHAPQGGGGSRTTTGNHTTGGNASGRVSKHSKTY